MANILETPVRTSSLNKAPQSVPSQNCEVEESKKSYTQYSKMTPLENQTHEENVGKTPSHSASQKFVSRCLQPQLEAENQSGLIPPTQVGRRLLKQWESPPVGATSEDQGTNNCLPCKIGTTTFQSPSACGPQGPVNGSVPGTACELAACLHERPRTAEVGGIQAAKQWKAAPGTTQDLEVQETPVRDKGSPADWSLGRDSLHMDSSNGFQYPLQKEYSIVPLDAHAMFSMRNICSHTKEDTTICPQCPGGCHEKTLVVKSQSTNCSEGHLAVSPGSMPFPDIDTLGPAGTHSGNAVLCSAAGKNSKSLQPRRQVHNIALSQQDSGFDSPHINFD